MATNKNKQNTTNKHLQKTTNINNIQNKTKTQKIQKKN